MDLLEELQWRGMLHQGTECRLQHVRACGLFVTGGEVPMEASAAAVMTSLIAERAS